MKEMNKKRILEGLSFLISAAFVISSVYYIWEIIHIAILYGMDTELIGREERKHIFTDTITTVRDVTLMFALTLLSLDYIKSIIRRLY